MFLGSEGQAIKQLKGAKYLDGVDVLYKKILILTVAN